VKTAKKYLSLLMAKHIKYKEECVCCKKKHTPFSVSEAQLLLQVRPQEDEIAAPKVEAAY